MIANLPNDLLFEITLFLKFKDVENLSRALPQKLYNNTEFWRFYVGKKFPDYSFEPLFGIFSWKFNAWRNSPEYYIAPNPEINGWRKTAQDLANAQKLKKFIDRSDVPFSSPLAGASFYGKTNIVKNLLESMINVNRVDARLGGPPLWIASIRGHIDIVKLLLKAGADVNATDEYYKATALWGSARAGHPSIVKILLEAGSDIESIDFFMCATPLCIASDRGHIEIVSILLEHGAKIDVRCNHTDWSTAWRTPLEIAKRWGNHEIVELLLRAIG